MQCAQNRLHQPLQCNLLLRPSTRRHTMRSQQQVARLPDRSEKNPRHVQAFKSAPKAGRRGRNSKGMEAGEGRRILLKAGRRHPSSLSRRRFFSKRHEPLDVIACAAPRQTQDQTGDVCPRRSDHVRQQGPAYRRAKARLPRSSSVCASYTLLPRPSDAAARQS